MTQGETKTAAIIHFPPLPVLFHINYPLGVVGPKPCRMTHPGDVRDSLRPLKKRIVTRQIAAKPWSTRTYENFVMDNLLGNNITGLL